MGSGKSSLLHALLGEMLTQDGEVNLAGEHGTGSRIHDYANVIEVCLP